MEWGCEIAIFITLAAIYFLYFSKQLKKNGMNAIAVTDHGNMFGIKELVDTCSKENGKVKDAVKALEKELADAQDEVDTTRFYYDADYYLSY